MICPKCRTENDDTFQFCSECGIRFSQDFGHNSEIPKPDNRFIPHPPVSASEPTTVALPHSVLNPENAPKTNQNVPVTQIVNPIKQVVPLRSSEEEFPTIIKPRNTYGNNPAEPNQTTRRSSKIPLILLGLMTIVLLGVVGYLIIPPLLKLPVPIPDHFGLFNRKDDKFTEVRRRDFTSLLKSRDELKDDASLPVMESNPDLIVYSDGQTIPVGDLKLIRLDSIKEDGSLENWEYQVAPTGENAQLKQIKVPSGLPKGKYALAVLIGNFDDGTHKLWPFRVENGAESTAKGQIMALKLKPTPTPTPTPVSTPTPAKSVTPTPEPSPSESPSDQETGTCIEDNVVVRSSPVISEANKIGRLDDGDKVVILKYSAKPEILGGVTARWIYLKTPQGKTGWVFGAYIK